MKELALNTMEPEFEFWREGDDVEARPYYEHPRSMVDDGCEIGAGTRIWAGAHVMSGAKVGAHCNIGENCFIEAGVVVGDGVTIKNNVALYSGALIEDNVFLGPSCVFTNVINPRAFVSRKSEFRPTAVRKGASVGANATIICGCEIGQFAMVGAGSVVTRNVPDYALVYGTPAKIHGYVCECGEKLDVVSGKACCPICGKQYGKIEETGLLASL